jgi:competence protein ComEC
VSHFTAVDETQPQEIASDISPVASRFFLASVAGAGWLAGIWLASRLDVSVYLWLTLAVAAAAGAVWLWRRGRWGLLLAAISAMALGGARFIVAQPPSDPGHIHYYNGGKGLEVVGEVVAEPELDDTRRLLRVAVRQVIIDGQPRTVKGTLLAETGRFAAVDYGATVTLAGDLDDLYATSSPGYAAYLRREGITSVMQFPDITITDTAGGSSFYRAVLAVRQRGREVIRAALPEPHAALLTGILLGDDSGMPAWLVEAFRETGMTHIIAISGFNIALIIALLDSLSGPFLSRRWAAILIILFVAVYAVLVGAAASVVRAAIMGAAYLTGLRLLGRPTLAVAGLFSAAILMTLVNPNTLWDIGFQLSFAATLGLLLYAGRWTRQAKGGLAALPRPVGQTATSLLSEGVIVTLAAQALTVPLILYHFGRLSLASLPANLLVLPAQPAVMFSGGIVLLAGMISPVLSQTLGWVAWPFLAYTIAAIHLLSRLPLAYVPFQLSSLGLVAIYAVIAALTLLAATDRKQKRAVMERLPVTRRGLMGAGAGVLAVILFLIWLSGRPDGHLHVVFLDVGQGDAILIQSPSGKQLLVDGGRYPSVVLDKLGQQMPFWDRSIDLVLATHPDEDHIAGLISVLERYDVAGLITNGAAAAEDQTLNALLTVAGEKGTMLHSAQAGEIIVLDEGVHLQILHTGATDAAGSTNDTSIVARLDYGNLYLLLTGDAEAATEAALVESGQSLTAAVLKAGHHGANTSSSQPFLAAVAPQIVVISVGRDNNFGHPTPAMLERVRAAGALVLRTDESGTLELVSDGQKMWWSVEFETAGD